MKTPNFGQRMAEIQREERNRTQERLYGAVKIKDKKKTWGFTLDWLITAVRTHRALGYKTEIAYNDETGKLDVIAYKEVTA